MIIVISSFGANEILKVFEHPQTFKQRSKTSFLDLTNTTEIFSASTQDFIPAIQIVDFSGADRNISKYLVPYLNVATKTNDELTGEFKFSSQLYKTELCTDLYSTGANPRLID